MNNTEEFDALPLEYKRDYGTALCELDISDLMNNSLLHRPASVFGLGLLEELGDLPLIQIGIISDNITNSVLVT